MKFIPNIKIVRKVWSEQGLLRIELGRYWEIIITRELAESMWNDPRQPPNLFKNEGFIRLVKEGDIIPFWYGFAYRDFDTDTGAYMPIPLNLVRVGWEWFKWYVLYRIKFDWPHALHRKQRIGRAKRQIREGELLMLSDVDFDS